MATVINPRQASEQFAQVLSALNDLVNTPSNEPDVDPNTGTTAHTNIGRARTPWVMSTVEMIAKNEFISWYINPMDISWNMPQRSTIVKTMVGTCMHVWPKPGRNTFYDEPVLNLNLQTGNIQPNFNSVYDETGGILAGDLIGKNVGDWSMSGGLRNFYAFLQLYDAPKITTDGRPNYVVIKYNSHVFQNMTLFGWFEPDGIKFSDSSNEPSKVDAWSVSFIVLDTVPKVSNNQLMTLVNEALNKTVQLPGSTSRGNTLSKQSRPTALNQ